MRATTPEGAPTPHPCTPPSVSRVLTWLITNFLLAVLLSTLGQSPWARTGSSQLSPSEWYCVGLGVLSGGMLALRVAGCMLYVGLQLARRHCACARRCGRTPRRLKMVRAPQAHVNSLLRPTASAAQTRDPSAASVEQARGIQEKLQRMARPKGQSASGRWLGLAGRGRVEGV